MATTQHTVSDFKLDPATGDMAVEDGDFVRIYDADVVEQRLAIRLRHFWNTWFLKANAGVRYYEIVFVKGVQRGAVEAEFRRVILECPNVQSLDSMVLDYDRGTRRLTVRWEVTHDFGTSTGETTV